MSADRVDSGFGDHGGSVAFKVDPGRYAGNGGGSGEAGGVCGSESVEGEAGASGVADEGDVSGVEAVSEEIVVGGNGVVESGREAIFGSEAVVENESARGGRAGDAGGEVAIIARRTEEVSAAVDIENSVSGAGFGDGEPVGGGFFDGDAFYLHVGRGGEFLEESVNIGAFLREGGRGLGDEFAPCGDGFCAEWIVGGQDMLRKTRKSKNQGQYR